MTLLSLIVKVGLELRFRSGVDTALEEHSCALKCCFTCRIYRGTHRIDYFFPISLTTTCSLQIGSNICHFEAIVSRSQRCAEVNKGSNRCKWDPNYWAARGFRIRLQRHLCLQVQPEDKRDHLQISAKFPREALEFGFWSWLQKLPHCDCTLDII